MESTLSYPVIDLARSQASSFEHERSVMLFLKPLAMGVLRLPYSMAGGMVAYALNRTARKFVDRAVWFRGATSAIQERSRLELLDADDEARGFVDEMEMHLLGIRREALKVIEFRSKNGPWRSPVGRAMKGLVRGVTELYEEVRAFKGAIQAHDADVLAMQGCKSPPSENVEAFESALQLLRER